MTPQRRLHRRGHARDVESAAEEVVDAARGLLGVGERVVVGQREHRHPVRMALDEAADLGDLLHERPGQPRVGDAPAGLARSPKMIR